MAIGLEHNRQMIAMGCQGAQTIGEKLGEGSQNIRHDHLSHAVIKGTKSPMQ